MTGVRRLTTTAVALALPWLLGACTHDPQKAKAKYLASGEKFMKKGQYSDASIEFRNALRLDPRFVDAYYQLAQADLAQREWQGAYSSLSKAIELDLGRLDARLDLGRLYFAARQFDKANDEAISILREQPDNVGAHQLLGAALIGQQKPDEALESFIRVTQLLPNDSLAFINLALVQVSLRRFPDAEESFKKAVAVDPQSSQAIMDLANFYYLQNKLPLAQDALQAGLKNNPEAIEIYVDWANILSDAGKLKEAYAVLDSLRNRLPKSPAAAIAIGDYYAGRSNFDKSIAEYQRGLAVGNSNLEIEKRMEELYLNFNRVAEAAKLEEPLMKQAPKDPLVATLQGRLLLAQGKNQEAIIALGSAIKAAPDSAQPHYFLGLAYLQTQSLGQANSEFQDAVRLSPGFPLALRRLAEINIAQNHPADALVYAQELVHDSPSDAQDRILLGEIFLRQGQLSAAEEQLLTAGRLAPSEPLTHLNLARVYAAAKKWPQADHEFKITCELGPANFALLSAYSDFLTAHQQGPKALELVRQFTAANPNNAEAHIKLGTLQLESKDTNAALSEFQLALQLDPQDIQGYVQLASLYESKKQTDEAIAQYQKALSVRPNFAPLITMIGNLYLDKGDLATARNYFAKAMEADSHFAVANANMAWVDAQEGRDLDVALGLAQSAKSQMPDVPSISDTLGWVMYKKHNYSGAIPLLQECVKKDPESAQYRYHLGLALVAAGQKNPGKTQLRAALEMNKLRPEDKEQAQTALATAN